jgi:hypothetical protein
MGRRWASNDAHRATCKTAHSPNSATAAKMDMAMQWIADRFNGAPTTPNCGQF